MPPMDRLDKTHRMTPNELTRLYCIELMEQLLLEQYGDEVDPSD